MLHIKYFDTLVSGFHDVQEKVMFCLGFQEERCPKHGFFQKVLCSLNCNLRRIAMSIIKGLNQFEECLLLKGVDYSFFITELAAEIHASLRGIITCTTITA